MCFHGTQGWQLIVQPAAPELVAVVVQEVAGKPLDGFLDVYRRDKRSVTEVHADMLAKTRRCEGCSGQPAEPCDSRELHHAAGKLSRKCLPRTLLCAARRSAPGA